MWNQVIPHIHAFLIQESFVFTGDQLDAGRTPEQQFEYDLYDKVRRFTYGSSGTCRAALAAGDIPLRTLNRWDETRGTDGKDYCQFDGAYSTTSAAGVPLDVVAYEYQSYRQKTEGAEWYAVGKQWGAIALTVPGVTGFGDGGIVR